MEKHLELPSGEGDKQDSKMSAVRMDCSYVGDCESLPEETSVFDSIVSGIKSFFGCSG